MEVGEEQHGVRVPRARVQQGWDGPPPERQLQARKAVWRAAQKPAAGSNDRVFGSARQKKKAEHSALFEARFRLYQMPTSACKDSF